MKATISNYGVSTKIEIIENNEVVCNLLFDIDHQFGCGVITDLISFQKNKGYAKAALIEAFAWLYENQSYKIMVSNSRSNEANAMYEHIFNMSFENNEVIAFNYNEEDGFEYNNEATENINN